MTLAICANLRHDEGTARKICVRRVQGNESVHTMSRVILSIAAVLIAVWVVFAVLRAVSGLIHLALVLAIVLVAYNLISGLRNRTDRLD